MNSQRFDPPTAQIPTKGNSRYQQDGRNTLVQEKMCLYCRKPILPRYRFCSSLCASRYWERVKVQYLEDAIWQRAENKCEECGLDATKHRHPATVKEWANRGRSPLEVHHILPICDGGKSTLDNLKLLCTECHQKHTRALADKKTKARQKIRLTNILRALTERGATGATTKQLCVVLQRAKTPLQEDLNYLKGVGYIERDKQANYYITVLGRAKLERINNEKKK